jgi:hypothetical protein
MTAYSASRGFLYTAPPGTDDAEATDGRTDETEMGDGVTDDLVDGSGRATADD